MSTMAESKSQKDHRLVEFKQAAWKQYKKEAFPESISQITVAEIQHAPSDTKMPLYV